MGRRCQFVNQASVKSSVFVYSPDPRKLSWSDGSRFLQIQELRTSPFQHVNQVVA